MLKVLIIKLGYSETLDPEIGKYSSLGDVLRTTVILHCCTDYHVTWLTDEKAYPLLRGNPYIHRILFYDLTTVLQLQAEQFDMIVNLEKAPGLCAFSDSIKAWNRYGFRFDNINGRTESHRDTEEALRIYTNIESKRKAKKPWQEVLFAMLGREWKNEEYILGYKPESKIEHKIGLNYLVGEKWPNKAWPMRNWIDLKRRLTGACLQRGQESIESYIEWINSCELIVTNDSLGLHMAIALKKKIVALFGPTSAYETDLYGRGEKILPKNDSMDSISVEEVEQTIKSMG